MKLENFNCISRERKCSALKKTVFTVLLLLLFTLPGCTQTLPPKPETTPAPTVTPTPISVPAPIPSNPIPNVCPYSIMYQDTWYVTYAEEISVSTPETLKKLGTIQSVVPISEMPMENFQTNTSGFLGCTLWLNGMDILLETATPGIYYHFYDHGTPSTPSFGQVAVVTEETALQSPFSYLYEDAHAPLTYQWIDLDCTRTLYPGDVVLVLSQADGVSQVVLPYGDIPFLYGYVSTDLLSTDIHAANQARLHNAALYDSIGGSIVTHVSTTVHIKSADHNWAEVVQTVGGDDTAYWVHTEDLSFEFDLSQIQIPGTLH